jgi:predicted deacetylase
VVPDWHGGERLAAGSAFVRTLSGWAADGDEIVLHGWSHTCAGLKEKKRDMFWTRFYTANEAEFRVASREETKSRLLAGRDLFEQFGWNPVGFIAPAWLIAGYTLDVLRELGFAYTTTRKEVIPLGLSAGSITSTSLCYSTRSGWRRGASLLWNPSLAQSLGRHPLLRLSLHPGDIAYPAVWKQIRRLVSEAMARGRIAQTYRDNTTRRSFPRPLAASA